MYINEAEIITKDYSTISTDSLVRHLNLDADLVDSVHLESILKSAIDWVETRINSCITPTTLSVEIIEFTGNRITLSNLDTVDSVFVNGGATTAYKLIRKYSSSCIILDNQITTPANITIEYSSGSNPKNNFIQAALIVANDLYDTDRSNYAQGVVNNNTVLRLLNLM